MQAVLDDDPTQTQQQLAEVLNVSQETISWSLQAMGKTNKTGKWVPHNFNDQQITIVKSLVKYCFNAKKESHICTELWFVMKNGFILETWSRENCGLPPSKDHNTKAKLFWHKTMLCVWWDQSGIVYYELLEPGKTVNAQRYHQEMINLNHVLIEKWSNGPKDMAKWFCYMTMPRLVPQN